MAYLGQSGGTGQVLTVSGGAPVWSNPGWFTAYEIDFTAQTPATYSSNGTYVIGGQNWTLTSLGTATSSLSVANGLRLAVAAGNTSYPNFAGPTINTLISPYAATQGDAYIWLRAETSVSTSGGTDSTANLVIASNRVQYQHLLRHTWQNSTNESGPANTQFYAPFMYNAGTYYPSSGSPGAYSANTTTNTSHDVKVFRLRGADRLDVWTGSWSSGWPSFNSLQYRGFVQISAAYLAPTGGTTNLWYPDDVLFQFSVNNSASTSATAFVNLKAIRIQTR